MQRYLAVSDKEWTEVSILRLQRALPGGVAWKNNSRDEERTTLYEGKNKLSQMYSFLHFVIIKITDTPEHFSWLWTFTAVLPNPIRRSTRKASTKSIFNLF